MKKKLFFLASALTVLAACSNNDDVPAPATEGQESIVIDLNALNYEDVMTRLSETNSLKDVKFVDGDVVKIVSELKASDNIDPLQADFMVFNSANAADSLELSISPDYLTVRMNVKGSEMAYMTFADANQQNEIIGLYEKAVPATRSGAPVVTRSSNGSSFSMNLTEMSEQMKQKAEAEGTSVLPEQELKYQGSAQTRGWFSNLFKKVAAVFKPAPAPVVKTATIDIYMLREKGCNPLTHEMNWQAKDAVESLKDVYSNVKFNVYIRNCDFGGYSNDSDILLYDFRKWLENGTYRNTNGVFMLCRWGGYEWERLGHTVGRAYLWDYNVNDDLKGCGVVSTSAWHKYTVAHEMGHTFGADHTHANLAWYERLAGYDLMAYGLVATWLGSGKHKDDANRAAIKKNLTLN